MKAITAGSIALMILLPVSSFALTNLQAPAAWTSFLQAEKAKRIAFYSQLKASGADAAEIRTKGLTLFQQMQDERNAFLRAHPDCQAYLDALRANHPK